MPPSEPEPVSGERRLPKAEDFPRTGPYSLAAPGPRFGARAIDLPVIAVPALIVVAATSETVAGQFRFDVPVVAAAGRRRCSGASTSSPRWPGARRTPGKWLLGLRIARYTDGKKPTPAQALLRALLPWSVLALPLGPFSIAAFLGVYGSGIGGGDLHRGLPDQAGGTLVISTR